MTDTAEDLLAQAITALSAEEFAERLGDWLAACFDFDNITMLAYRGEQPPERLHTRSTEGKVHAALETTYRAGAWLLDPFLALDRGGAAPGLYRLGDIAPDHFTRSDYYLSYYRGTTLLDELVYLTRPAPGVSVHICLGRDASSGRRFPQRDLEAAAQVAPVACALAARHWAGLTAGRTGGDTLAGLWQELRDARGIELTARQSEIALLILQGHSTASIAARLGISPQTVKVFRRQLYARCGISSQAELFSLMMPILARIDAGRGPGDGHST